MSLDTGIALLTLADVKSYIEGSTTGTTTHDEQYNQIINDLSAMFNDYTQRYLLQTAYTSSGVGYEYYDGNGADTLFLNNWPLTTSMTIWIDNDRAFTTDTIVPSSDLRVWTGEKGAGRVTLYNEIFKTGVQNIQVSYTAGYSVSTTLTPLVPYSLKRAAREMARFLWNREENADRIGIRSESAEGMSRTFETNMPWSVQKVLDLYRNYRNG
jgi:hypothetical protein